MRAAGRGAWGQGHTNCPRACRPTCTVFSTHRTVRVMRSNPRFPRMEVMRSAWYGVVWCLPACPGPAPAPQLRSAGLHCHAAHCIAVSLGRWLPLVCPAPSQFFVPRPMCDKLSYDHDSSGYRATRRRSPTCCIARTTVSVCPCCRPSCLFVPACPPGCPCPCPFPRHHLRL